MCQSLHDAYLRSLASCKKFCADSGASMWEVCKIAIMCRYTGWLIQLREFCLDLHRVPGPSGGVCEHVT